MRLIRTILLLAGMATLAACASSGDGTAGAAVVPSRQLLQQAQPPEGESNSVRAAPARHAYTVHFDHDSADIRASAMQILHGAAQIAKQVGPATIRITGYTDARGRKSYNQKLSERRAAAVADQFRKLGVNVAAVEVRGMGAADPVKTVSGKAPRDRRVEIVFEGAPARAAAQTHAISPLAPRLQNPAAISAHPAVATAKTVAMLSAPPERDCQSVPLRTQGKTAIKRNRARTATTEAPPASPDA